MTLAQFHQLGRHCATEHFDSGFGVKGKSFNGIAHRGSRRVGMIVFRTEMAQPNALRHRGEVRAQSCSSEHIRQVSTSTRDAILEIFGIRSVCQHIGVVVGFDDQVFCTLHIGNQVVGELSRVGDETEGGHGNWSVVGIFSHVCRKNSHVF